MLYVTKYESIYFQAPVDFIKTEEFQAMPFVKMSFYYTIWVKGILAKYIGAWLLAEGAVILSGKHINKIQASQNSLA